MCLRWICPCIPESAKPRPPKNSSWKVTDEEFQAYQKMFRETDANHDGHLAGQEAKAALEKYGGGQGLPREELKAIWNLADVNHDGRLTLNQFVCAMHLITRRQQGLSIPTVLPPELARGVASEAASPWKVTDEDFRAYQETFRRIDANHDGLLAGQEARAALEKHGLPREELKQIWNLSDVNHDGRLTLNQFVCASHLITRRKQGLPLPTVLPPELARGVASERDLPAPTSSSAPSWKVTNEEFQSYQQMFQKIDANRDGLLAGQEARAVLEKQGLPREELKAIWNLSDVNHDGRLTLNQFVCAMHLITRRKQGMSIPAVLPPELARGVASEKAAAVSPVPAAAEAATTASSRSRREAALHSTVSWKVSDEEFQHYQAQFLRVAPSASSKLGGQEAKAILEQSGLPREDLQQIWLLSDVNGDGRLTMNQFICAMHLASRRKQGAPLPSVLPPELERGVRGEANSAPPTKSSINPVWKLSNEDQKQYQDQFIQATGKIDGSLPGPKAVAILQQSGLPREALKTIWQLSDVNEDGCLTLGQFMCAMHLARGVRRGAALPPALPPELVEVVALGAPAGGSAPASAAWKVSNEDFAKYSKLFQALDKHQAGALTGAQAASVLQEVGLPREELKQIWALSDVNGDGLLTLNEFVCAMHLSVCRKNRGMPIPTVLPPELARGIA